jgi:hypothetical protein
MNWLDAEEQAREWGGHLVTINDEEEENWLKDQFGTDDLLWIGFNDRCKEKNWEWVSKEPVTYENWAPGEPNNCAGVDGCAEDAAVMNWGDLKEWNDVRVTDPYLGIVERPGP